MILLYFLLSVTCHDTLAALTANSVLGAPSIQCESKRIELSISTKEPFSGKVFIKGNVHRKECVTDYSDNNSSHLNLTEVRTIIDYNICNTERIRSLSPIGVTYANTVVVQFHKTFITKGDKSYHIRCFYAETEKTVASNFEVSMIPTGAIFHDMELPNCAYTVRSQTPNGPLIRSAKVGDVVFHRWECKGNNDFYGMAVHSCFVENTNGAQNQILDAFGCSSDLSLLPNLIYSNDLGLAYSETQVFKYPDYSYVHFRCQIRICTKMDGSCKGITPPSCIKRKIRRHLDSNADRLLNKNDNLDVVTKEILVLEETDAQNSTLLAHSSNLHNPDEPVSSVQHHNHWQLCANRVVLIIILLAFILFFLTSLSFIVYVMYNQNRQHYKNKKVDSPVSAQMDSYFKNTFFDNPTFVRT